MLSSILHQREMKRMGGLDPYESDAPPRRNRIPQEDGREQPAKLKSVIVSLQAEGGNEAIILTRGENSEVAGAQKKVLSKDLRQSPQQPRTKSPRNTPNIFRGASSKKRKLSQINKSPAPSRRNGAGKASKPTSTVNTQGRSDNMPVVPENPPIQLIPAMAKRNSDFRVHASPAP